MTMRVVRGMLLALGSYVEKQYVTALIFVFCQELRFYI